MEIYQPSEDSYLMSKILKEKIPKIKKLNSKLKFLEIGAGSGINLETVFNLGIKKENIFSCDINKDSVNYCKKLGFNCVHSDLFQNIKGSYDIIIFNPPYLPYDKNEPKDSRTSTTGGKRGNEIIIKFLKQAKFHLKKD
ncbi:methyltransferase, partial [Candidatus Woesearchaeota archaeon]|nr:methyltransferase [Candidatus Woesearchaeota archaeon]